MVGRATGISNKTASPGEQTLARAADTPVLRALPLTIAPLLVPYKKQGRLSLRIERLHHLARLSAGRNNGDHSWSLTLDELEDLTYLLPETVDETHTLAIRVIALNGGSTLAVLDFPVTPGAETPSHAPQANSNAEAERELNALRDELAAVKKRLAFRDGELAAVLQKKEVREVPSAPAATVESDLTAARAAWKVELDTRLASSAAEAASDIERSRKVWQAEWSARVAAAGKEGEDRAEQRFSQTREIWQKESEDALSKATLLWREDEAKRFADLEARWKEETALALAQARADGQAASTQERVVSLEAAIQEREKQIAAFCVAAEETHEKTKRETEARFAEAEQAGKASEAARLSTMQAEWREQADRALAQARAETEAARGQVTTSESTLREKIASLEKAIAERETALARTTISSEQAREQWQRETEAALSQAENDWKAAEALRLAVAETAWREQSGKVLAEVRAEIETARGRGSENESRLNEKIANLEKALDERETALARSTIAAEQAREQWLRESEAALSKAKSAWKTEEALRYAEGQAEWRENSTKALVQARAETELARVGADEIERRMREQMAALEARLAERETALARAGIAAAEAHERLQRESEAVLLAAKTSWQVEETARLADAEREWRAQSATQLAAARAETDAMRRAFTENESRLQQGLRDAEAGLAKAKAQWGAEEAARLAQAEARWREQIAASLAQARAETEAARLRWQEETQTALRNAEGAWKTDETARFAQAEAQWRKRSAATIAEATARYEAAETALTQLRIKAEADRNRHEQAVTDRVREEYMALQAARNGQEIQASDAEHTPIQLQPKIVLQPTQFYSVDEVAEKRQAKARSRPVRDVAIAASLAASAIFYFYPHIAPYVPDSVTSNIAMMTEGMNTANSSPTPSSVAQNSVSPKQHTAVVLNPVNVRAAPSATAAIVLTAERGMEVAMLEHHGNWMHVRLAGKDGQGEGWVYSSYLKDAADKPVAVKPD